MEISEKSKSTSCTKVGLQFNVSGAVQRAGITVHEMEGSKCMASEDVCSRVERQPQSSTKTLSRSAVHQTYLHRELVGKCNNRRTNSQHATNLQRGNSEQYNSKSRNSYQSGRDRKSKQNKGSRSIARGSEIGLRSTDVISRSTANRGGVETGPLRGEDPSNSAEMERTNTSSKDETTGKTQLVVGTFNCRGWNSKIMKNLIEEISESHSKPVILACQETWKYALPVQFKNELSDQYHFIHEPGMNSSKARKKGRPFGGVAFIISKSVAFKVKHINCRCLSILLTEYNILVNNIYLPANDSRIGIEQNLEQMSEAIGHLDAAHNLTNETADCITLGDFNVDANDATRRSQIVQDSLHRHSYDLEYELQQKNENEYSHSSGRTIDRILSTKSLGGCLNNIKILRQYLDSDHHPVVSSLNVTSDDYNENTEAEPYISWKKASDQALFSYSMLCQGKCAASLEKFQKGEINGADLYEEIVNNMTTAAKTCFPKVNPGKTPNRHNIPMWRERMSAYKLDVDYWLQVQFINGGPRRCASYIREELRISKSRYRHQLRKLRREIEINIAENVTVQNCHRRLFKKPKIAQPAAIDGHSRPAQPAMWRNHFREVFSADEQPYSGNILHDISNKINNDHISSFNHLNLTEINNAISHIDSNKSYKRHNHWKYLHTITPQNYVILKFSNILLTMYYTIPTLQTGIFS